MHEWNVHVVRMNLTDPGSVDAVFEQLCGGIDSTCQQRDRLGTGCFVHED